MNFLTEEFIYHVWDKSYHERSTFPQFLSRYYTKRINGLYTQNTKGDTL